jgi:hypothetical protein
MDAGSMYWKLAWVEAVIVDVVKKRGDLIGAVVRDKS